MKIVLATWNKSKQKWLKEGLRSLPFPILTLEHNQYKHISDVEETGDTCEANALLKARTIPNDGQSIIIGEDSGLFIQALGHFPGVKTARWMDGTDDDRAAKILEDMTDISERDAYFQSALAAIFPDGDSIVVEAKLPGKIARKSRGDQDTGYSQIFELAHGQTIAEMEPEAFERNDHRRMAIAKLKTSIEEKMHEHTNEY